MDAAPLITQEMQPDFDAEIRAVEAASRDYSDTPRRVLFVLGAGEAPAVDVFRQLAALQHTTIASELIEEMAAGSRRSLIITTPIQMVPEIVVQLARANVAVYQVQVLNLRAELALAQPRSNNSASKPLGSSGRGRNQTTAV